MNRYLANRPPLAHREIYQRIGTIYRRIRDKSVPIVYKGLWRILERVEAEEARRTGDPEFKFGTNEEMLQHISERVQKRA